MREKTGEISETFGARRLMGAAVASDIERDLRELVPRVLQQESAKVVAFRASATQRSADNWREGLNLPQVPHFLMLARQYPELRAKVLEWLDASTGEGATPPDAVLDQIAKLLAGRQ